MKSLRATRGLSMLCEASLALAVLAAAVFAFSHSKAKADGDEAEWIGTARYFDVLFVQHDLSDEAWADSYWTRTQPMLARYVIGAWLWWRGYDLAAFNPNHDHDVGWEANQRRGTAPPNDVLDQARVPMRGLAAGSVLVVYLVVRVLAGPFGGVVAAALFLGSPYLREHLIRAKGDTTLLVCLLLALFAAVAALSRPSRRARLGWGVASGCFLGLAMGAKLTATLAFAAVIPWSTLALPRYRSAGSDGARSRWALDWRAWMAGAGGWAAILLIVAALAFVASDPYLYRDPLGRTILMFQNRQAEMDEQTAREPYRAYDTIPERAGRVWERSLFHETWGMSYTGWPIEAILAGMGFVALLWRAVKRPDGPEAFTIWWAVCLFAGITLGLRYLLQHYFVPSAVAGLVLGGAGAGLVLNAALGAARSLAAGFLGSRRSGEAGHRPLLAPGGRMAEH